MIDYDVFPFEDGNGALLIGETRSAMYRHAEPGRTEILLTEQSGSHEFLYEGVINQYEKAEGLCVAWIEERFVDLGFRQTAQPVILRKDVS